MYNTIKLQLVPSQQADLFDNQNDEAATVR
jgi:hypothetical protein